MPVMFGVDRILDGRTTAVLVPGVTRDRFRASPEDSWHSIDELPIGGYAYEVDHSGHLISTQGGVCTLKNLPDKQLVIEVIITEIQLVRASELTAEHYAALGPRTMPLGFDPIEAMGDRRAWFMRVMPVSDAPVM